MRLLYPSYPLGVPLHFKVESYDICCDASQHEQNTRNKHPEAHLTMKRGLAINGPITCIYSQEPRCDDECQREYAKDAMDNFVPSPVVLPVSRRVNL